MTDLLVFLETHRDGFYTALIMIFGLIFAVQWLAWILGRGRFVNAARRKGEASGAGVVLADLTVKIIDDFRHLLALVIVVIFFAAMAYALYAAGKDVDKVADALQAVTSALGGLIGAIIGYYFGESAAKKLAEANDTQDSDDTLDENVDIDVTDDDIQPVDTPTEVAEFIEDENR